MSKTIPINPSAARNAFIETRIVDTLRDSLGLTSIRNLSQIAEHALIRFALEKCRGSQTSSARLLGRATFYTRMRAHGIDHVDYGGKRGRAQRKT